MSSIKKLLRTVSVGLKSIARLFVYIMLAKERRASVTLTQRRVHSIVLGAARSHVSLCAQQVGGASLTASMAPLASESQDYLHRLGIQKDGRPVTSFQAPAAPSVVAACSLLLRVSSRFQGAMFDLRARAASHCGGHKAATFEGCQVIALIARTVLRVTRVCAASLSARCSSSAALWAKLLCSRCDRDILSVLPLSDETPGAL